MNRVSTFAAAAAVVVVAALLLTAVLPGALADPTDDGLQRPGRVSIAEVDVAHGAVGGQTVELRVLTRLEHHGNPTENVSLRVRAVDAESGFVARTKTVGVGTLERDGEVPVNATLRVEREGGYRIETTLYRGAERVDSGGKQVSGLAALRPAYAETSVRFTEEDTLPPVAFSIARAEAGDNRTTLDVAASLTNAGDDPSGDLRVTLVLRQAESNIVAARESVDVGTIRPGRTETVETEVTVPGGYNYYIDAVLWKDGVIVDTARGAANLDPTRTLRVNETREEVELEVSDFEGEAGERPTNERMATPATESAAPGFGPVVALAALLSAAFLARRRWSP